MATAADFLDVVEDLVKCVLKNLDFLFVSWKKLADRCANSASPGVLRYKRLPKEQFAKDSSSK